MEWKQVFVSSPDVLAIDLAASGGVDRAQRVPEALDAGGTAVDDASGLSRRVRKWIHGRKKTTLLVRSTLRTANSAFPPEFYFFMLSALIP